ncbi:aldo/keto reductase [Methylocella sp.]|uniref:aldo/keto reductase n=1 Tax=Methylocella sp. TaxID=1978226 RepID=UPI003784CF74
MERISRYVPLGAGGPQVSALGLGCMSLSGAYGAGDDAEGVKLIRSALDRGVTFLDTADMYGWGRNETLVGAALAGRRGEAFVATKFGYVRGEGDALLINGRPDYVFRACDASLTRLKLDHIDLYYQHRVDPDVPIDETVDAMGQLVRKGKVRHIGLSEARPETIRRAQKVFPVSAAQTEFSLLYRVEAQETLETARELGIAFVACSPLGRGLLTSAAPSSAGIAGDRPATHPRFSARNLARNLELVDRLAQLAKAKGCSPSQLALAYVLAKGAIPIPGTRRLARLEKNVEALDVALSEQDAAALEQAIPADAAAGERYPPDLLAKACL